MAPTVQDVSFGEMLAIAQTNTCAGNVMKSSNIGLISSFETTAELPKSTKVTSKVSFRLEPTIKARYQQLSST